MSKNTSLASLIADLESTAPKDYDPEDIVEPLNDNQLEDNSENENDESAARDHYVSVGKSKLRNDQPLLDDPRYAGKRTSRKDIFSDEEKDEDDEENQSEEEIDNEESRKDIDASDNDDSFDDDEDLLNKAETYVEEEVSDDTDQSEEDDSEKEEGEEEEDVEEEENDNDDDDDDDDDDDEINTELKKIQEEEKNMISQLSKSAQADVEKGQHVRQQLTLWDNCLESRIRMQKVIDDANKLPQKDAWYDFLAKTEGIEIELEEVKNDLHEIIDDLMDIRSGLLTQNGAVELPEDDYNSRKRHIDDDDDVYIDTLWKDISKLNEVFTPYRNSTLEKWSNKVQAAAGARLNKKFKAFDQNVMTQIETIMADKTSLIKRTQLQRSDYKILGKISVTVENQKEEQQQEEIDTGKKADRHLNTYDVEIFDDQDFYQQQLRELIESRMVDTNDPVAIGMRWAARKQTENKKKKAKTIDRKASKGRKLRFNVHEKLQNFMAPIPNGEWHESMIDELYSSLLGQKLNNESIQE
ncbi:apoptosis antagonizing transcription factor-domain-containing protein [Cokeromyces recurvatus]|uniref:apoptosis antagonizing transcription factor-domain-containing protein n=1 Tax=Cokeromyces recurvatus TaxID=90255 RepID=UPI002220AB25|nr:apoptosis antagonizing transcription factor-domain-containing protein [Cokeromyces recurvatus]KAI7905236.1 apoptosis antagonizing transcription factor-domain-containing protein [Cokeromyces recurvatus]